MAWLSFSASARMGFSFALAFSGCVARSYSKAAAKCRWLGGAEGVAIGQAIVVVLLAKLLAGANPYLSLALEIGAGVVVYVGLMLAVRPRLAREIALFLPFFPFDRVGRRYAIQPPI